MKRISFFLFFLLPLLGNAQTKFVIDGSLDAPDNTMLHLIYHGPENWQVDSVKLLHGKFHFSGEYTEPVKANLTMRMGNDDYRSVSFYLENVPLKISAGKDLRAATVKGGTVNREWAAWEKMNGVDNDNPDSVLIASYVSKYPASVVSLDLVIEKVNTEKYYSLFEQLAPELKTLPRAQEYDRFVNGHRALKVGQMAPDFTVVDPDGKSWTLSDYRGKYVYLDFWASWCKPCRAAHPWLSKINERFKDKGFVLLGISLDYKKEAWLKAIAEDHVQWKQGSELKGFNGEIAKLYQIGILPNGILIDPDGRIMEKGNIEKTLEERLGN
ncbi:TlpA disulfide reductase family protein [Pseudobacter ginsenosidimutans]|uniref:Peroxiredoxin n=1 Tax=Pseudobacter ginsenosidimutans TaxID=661488 RepID=A0A4Q7MZG2_9BACT|nr:TlpA disulfide reductase family protein [Pseudobacter ginsenosidimutans]QEC43297.1 AhpC/TSA family protein [Pseudobacter ginsenosidimutans]RZS74660.1 peroxiredoxin [Pseudobacter ginsenosidimutans]